MFKEGRLRPTYGNCFVQDAQDALLLVQAVVDNRLVPVDRRPQDSERNELIKSGNVFIFDEKQGHIQRWTDGISWSPSRILGEFLIYREKKTSRLSTSGISQRKSGVFMNVNPDPKGPSAGGIKKPTAYAKHRTSVSSVDKDDASLLALATQSKAAAKDYTGQSLSVSSSSLRNMTSEYNLYGSLTSNDQYKENGLIKKTISIPYQSSSYRLISYYFPEDVEDGRLVVPSRDPNFSDVNIQPELAETKNVQLSISIDPSNMGFYSSANQPYSPVYGSGSMSAPYTATAYAPSMSGPMAHGMMGNNSYSPRTSVQSTHTAAMQYNNMVYSPYVTGTERQMDPSDSYLYSQVDPNIERGYGQTEEYPEINSYPRQEQESTDNDPNYSAMYAEYFQRQRKAQAAAQKAKSSNASSHHGSGVFSNQQDSQNLRKWSNSQSGNYPAEVGSPYSTDTSAPASAVKTSFSIPKQYGDDDDISGRRGSEDIKGHRLNYSDVQGVKLETLSADSEPTSFHPDMFGPTSPGLDSLRLHQHHPSIGISSPATEHDVSLYPPNAVPAINLANFQRPGKNFAFDHTSIAGYDGIADDDHKRIYMSATTTAPYDTQLY